MVQRALQVAEGDVGIHGQSFHLVEDGRVRGVGGIGTMHFARNHNADRRRRGQHGANLHRRRMRAQQEAIALRFLFLSRNEDCVLCIARGMVGWKVQGFKVEVVGLDLGTLRHGVSHSAKDTDDLVHRPHDRMFRA